VQQPARQLQLHLLPGLPGRWIHALQQGRSRLTTLKRPEKNSLYKDLEKNKKGLAYKGIKNHGKRLAQRLPIKTIKSIKKDFTAYKRL
jgi:hypothetical protein